MAQSKRQQVEETIYHYVQIIDPSGFNVARYKKRFAKMSDEMFDLYMREIRDKKRQLTIFAPNLKVTLKTENLIEAAEKLNVKLFERIRRFDDGVTNRWYTTPQQYLILELPVRRLKQHIMDKISVPDSDTKTDLYTGQVVKPDKGASMSLVEMQVLDNKGLTSTITEMMTVRGGNPQAWAQVKASMEETGQASLNARDLNAKVRSAVVAQTYLEAMGLANNLVE